ncbi:uncharacterized protein CIMG_13615 [Coccidioides immitis RS]|uniref:Uncharacterized protein n=1 Tax=Coccidioides immitis (strain RS) TaxID=246410 RepID=J3K2J0_COCIM|nr:uncharacterized protein CIMG_13615 [Coccidioides immitis RS]EAS28310.3 hypothetical protein CIMG_13615 [Coccidioides immitis RS]
MLLRVDGRGRTEWGRRVEKIMGRCGSGRDEGDNARAIPPYFLEKTPPLEGDQALQTARRLRTWTKPGCLYSVRKNVSQPVSLLHYSRVEGRIRNAGITPKLNRPLPKECAKQPWMYFCSLGWLSQWPGDNLQGQATIQPHEPVRSGGGSGWLSSFSRSPQGRGKGEPLHCCPAETFNPTPPMARISLPPVTAPYTVYTLHAGSTRGDTQ